VAEPYKIPKNWADAVKVINDVCRKLRESATRGEQKTVQTYLQWLDQLTSAYAYLVPLHLQWKAILENNEVAYFVQRQVALTDKETGKLQGTVKAIELEAASATAEERYKRNYLDGWCQAAYTAIQTCKRHVDVLTDAGNRHRLNVE
jgi:hypothetical protein